MRRSGCLLPIFPDDRGISSFASRDILSIIHFDILAHSAVSVRNRFPCMGLTIKVRYSSTRTFPIPLPSSRLVTKSGQINFNQWSHHRRIDEGNDNCYATCRITYVSPWTEKEEIEWIVRNSLNFHTYCDERSLCHISQQVPPFTAVVRWVFRGGVIIWKAQGGSFHTEKKPHTRM